MSLAPGCRPIEGPYGGPRGGGRAAAARRVLGAVDGQTRCCSWSGDQLAIEGGKSDLVLAVVGQEVVRGEVDVLRALEVALEVARAPDHHLDRVQGFRFRV